MANGLASQIDTSGFAKPPAASGPTSLADILKIAMMLRGDKTAALTPPTATPSEPVAPRAPIPGMAGTPPAESFQGPGAPGQAAPNFGVEYHGAALKAPSPYDAQYAAADQENGLPAGFSKGTGWIESRHNPKAHSAGSQYKGLMQIGNDEAKKYGVDVWDADSSIKGAAKIAAANQYNFRQVVGRDPSAGELYLMHQQGPAGAIALLRNPDKPAWQVVRPFYKSDAMARKVISGNGGNPNAPAGQFANHWISHFSAPSSSQEQTAAIPGMARGGVITDPATVIDDRTGQPVARIAEAGPEAVSPIMSDAAPIGGAGVQLAMDDKDRAAKLRQRLERDYGTPKPAVVPEEGGSSGAAPAAPGVPRVDVPAQTRGQKLRARLERDYANPEAEKPVPEAKAGEPAREMLPSERAYFGNVWRDLASRPSQEVPPEPGFWGPGLAGLSEAMWQHPVPPSLNRIPIVGPAFHAVEGLTYGLSGLAGLTGARADQGGPAGFLPPTETPQYPGPEGAGTGLAAQLRARANPIYASAETRPIAEWVQNNPWIHDNPHAAVLAGIGALGLVGGAAAGVVAAARTKLGRLAIRKALEGAAWGYGFNKAREGIYSHSEEAGKVFDAVVHGVKAMSEMTE
jgi:hypothetical protein